MATIQRAQQEVTLSAAVTVLDGTTTGYTYQFSDKPTVGVIELEQDTDAVIITISGTGSANNACVFNMLGYGVDTPAERIYTTVTATLGTAVAGTSQLYADTILGTDYNTQTVGIYDSGNNAVCKMVIDTSGIKYLLFELVSFTTMTAVKFHVREVGQV